MIMETTKDYASIPLNEFSVDDAKRYIQEELAQEIYDDIESIWHMQSNDCDELILSYMQSKMNKFYSLFKIAADGGLDFIDQSTYEAIYAFNLIVNISGLLDMINECDSENEDELCSIIEMFCNTHHKIIDKCEFEKHSKGRNVTNEIKNYLMNMSAQIK